MRFLTESSDPGIKEIFGEINPPASMNFFGDNPVQGLGKFIGFGINMFILLAGMFLLIYLLWGALDWISSGGEKEKLVKAQHKITNALIGMILVFVVLTVFTLLTGNILGIIRPNGSGGFDIKLPTLE